MLAIKYRLKFIFRFSLALFGLWFLIFANYGFSDYLRFKKNSDTLSNELRKTIEEKEKMQMLVNSIKTDNLDYSLLEIQARKVLGFARKNEIIFFWK